MYISEHPKKLNYIHLHNAKYYKIFSQLPVYYDIAPLETAEFSNLKALALNLRNKSWKPECVLSFNMDWRILVFYLEQKARDNIY